MKIFNALKRVMLAFVVMLAFAVVGAQEAPARSYTTETLNYQIVYHWGIIWKHAGNAQLSIQRSGAGYYAQLIGKTRSWADNIYPVRDTLKCYMTGDFLPTRYEKITHEKNYFAHDVVSFTRGSGKTSAQCTRTRRGKPTQHVSLSSPGNAYDMVSVFYMLRNLDFNNLVRNRSYSTVIFSGKRKETVTIQYRGVETIKLRNKSKHQAHKVTFHFTQDGRKKSSDDLSAWLSIDASRVPLLLVGKLPVGEVKCYLGGSLNQ
jgi:hypothetical protein